MGEIPYSPKTKTNKNKLSQKTEQPPHNTDYFSQTSGLLFKIETRLLNKSDQMNPL
jgi:hypothetical protein